MKIKKLFGFFIVLFITSCIGDEYLNDALSETIIATPGVAVPIGFVELNVHNIVSKNTNRVEFTSDENGQTVVSVFQKEDSVEFFGLNEIYNIPQTSLALPVPFTTINGGPLTISDSVTLSIPNGSIIEATSKIVLTIVPTNFPYPVNLSITLTDVSTPAQNPYSKEIKIPAGSSWYRDTLLDATTNLKNNKFAFKISFSKQNIGDNSNNIGGISLSAQLSDLTYIKGTLNQTPLTVDPQTFGLNMGIFKLGAEGTILYDNPSFEITYTNSTPFNALITPNITGINSSINSSIELETTPFLIKKRASTNTATIDTIKYNKGNSNIKEFVNNTPDTLQFSGSGLINPANENNEISEISGSQGIYLGYNLNLPLQISVDSLIVKDTVDFDNTEFLDMVKRSTITTINTNGFPFEARTILQFCDDAFSILDTLQLQLVNAAPVDSKGYVIDELIQTISEDRELTSTKLENFKKSKHIILVTIIFTTNYNTNKMVVIQDKNYLQLQLSLKSQLDASLK